eukprot:9482885-Pyramimonas_sp.AAC.3
MDLVGEPGEPGYHWLDSKKDEKEPDKKRPTPPSALFITSLAFGFLRLGNRGGTSDSVESLTLGRFSKLILGARAAGPHRAGSTYDMLRPLSDCTARPPIIQLPFAPKPGTPSRWRISPSRWKDGG